MQDEMTDHERFSALRDHSEQRRLVYAAGVPLVITEVSAEHDPPRIRVKVEPVRLVNQARSPVCGDMTRPRFKPCDRVYLDGELGTVVRDVYTIKTPGPLGTVAENDHTMVLWDGGDHPVMLDARLLQRATHQMEELVKDVMARYGISLE